MDDERGTIELYELILKSLEGTISREEFEVLKSRLSEEPDDVKHYVDFMATYAAMYQPGSACAFVLAPDADAEMRFDNILWHALAENEKVAAGVEVSNPDRDEVSTTEREFSERRGIIKRRRKVSRLSLYTAIISTAALAMMMAYVIFNPRVEPIVAAVTDVMDARWAEDFKISDSYMELRPGRMRLSRGFAEITFDGGAVVLVQGPADVEVETDSQMFLHKGKIWSYVPESALGFTIRTPGATIVDYGTEFGVAVRENGQTEAYVFNGRVDLRTGSNPRVFEDARRLGAGQGGVVDKEGKLAEKEVRADHFARGMGHARASKSLLGGNLVVNGDFEADVGVVFDPDKQIVPNIKISGWDDNAEATVLTYLGNVKHGYPDLAKDVVPNRCGRNFFVGIGNCTISQQIDISPLSHIIESGLVEFDFSAWLGGFSDHPDSAELVITFLNDNSEVTKTEKLGPLKITDRRNETGFVNKRITGNIPYGTKRIRIELKSYQRIGLADSYVDNISLVLSSD